MSDIESFANDRFANEVRVVGRIADVLKAGMFNGCWAQDVAISLMYIQGLHAELKKQMDTKQAAVVPMAALNAPVEVSIEEGAS